VHDLQDARGASLTGPSDALAEKPDRRYLLVLLAVAAVALVVDGLSKMWAVAALGDREPVPLLDGVLTLRLVRNPGAAFGVAQGLTIAFSLVAVVVAVVILRVARRLRSTGWAVSLGLVLGGALGNLVDRVFREPGVLRGWVVDFLELPNWPVFNLADVAIVSGGVLMVLLSVLGRQLDGSRAQGAR
jgi:signal peptidase II